MTLNSLLILALALLLALPAMAAETANLTIYHGRENVRFDLYHVAAAGDAGWQATPDFAVYPVILPDGDSTASEWRTAAETLAAYTARDQLVPAFSDRVAGGNVNFSALEEGLYLLVGEPVQESGTLYTPVPVLVQVQGDTAVVVKAEETAVGPGAVDYAVTKIWAGGNADRTWSVTIQLLCDGQLYDTVTLSVLNNWRYTWSAEPGHRWQVTEENCPDGFTVSVEQNAGTFTVTNTWRDSTRPVPPGQPGSSGQAGSSSPTASPAPQDERTPAQGALLTAGGAQLPQTGQLWWPVPLLLLLGVLFMVIGRTGAHRRHKDDHER